eukprot:CAMPEP_0194445334 /NCGR_PEP_ID=MMETSP0176-20130528/127799_1 /TAXON_ID=216777 /ORGANISM="Proboscia alata, Strain PI-D3" /LENGTH=738 /DNA_ID=CAMNT_0039271875 /DNA_START=9 /DNA_END=2225 /DNA_ORIENTATION=+
MVNRFNGRPFLWITATLFCGIIRIGAFVPNMQALHKSSISRLHTPRNDRTLRSNYRNSVLEPKHLTTASSSIGDDDSDTPLRGGGASPPPPLPTLPDILKFALPCLALWIAQPLLSLVDTAAIGLSAKAGQGATQLGALGPATTFIDGSAYLFAFLNVATTNLYANAIAVGKQNGGKDGGGDSKPGEGVVRTAARISLLCGIGMMALLLKYGRALLSIYLGPTAASNPAILEPAVRYVQIRSLSLPVYLLGNVLQASLLGAQDSVTPLIAIVCSTVINVVGDFVGVVKLGYGLAGAAVATTAAEVIGKCALISPSRKKLLSPHSTKGFGILPPYGAKDDSSQSTRAFLKFAAPVLTLIFGKIAAFGVMTHVAAALPGEATLASHQIILSLFFFVSPFLEVISQTAQAFLPQFYAVPTNGSQAEYTESAYKVANKLLSIGILVGLVMAGLASSIPRFLPQILTNCPLVQAAVRPLALPLFLGALLLAPVAVCEGVLLARRELGFLAGVYAISTALLPPVLFRIKRSSEGTVGMIWNAFAVFQLFRAVMFAGRLWGVSLFFFVSPFLEVISQTAQAFLPQFYAVPSDGSKAEYTESAYKVANKLLSIGILVGLVMAGLASSIPRFLPQILTNSPLVQAAVRPLALPLFLGALLLAPVAVCEGVLLARRELGFLAGVYAISTALLPPVLFRIKRSSEGTVGMIWNAFAVFQLFRAVMFAGRLWGGRFLRKIIGSTTVPDAE